MDGSRFSELSAGLQRESSDSRSRPPSVNFTSGGVPILDTFTRQELGIGKNEAKVMAGAVQTAERNPGGFNMENISPREKHTLEWDLATARRKDREAVKNGEIKTNTPRELEDPMATEARRMMTEPISQVGTIGLIDHGANSVPVYGLDPEKQMAMSLRQEIINDPENTKRETTLELNLPTGNYKVEPSDFIPTMRAYLESRGMPIKRGTTFEDLDRSKQYVSAKLGEKFPDDADYSHLTQTIEDLALQLDAAKAANRSFTPILEQLTTVHAQRNKTIRALYAGIMEGIDWRRESIGKRNENLNRYRVAIDTEVGKKQDELKQKSIEEIKSDIVRFTASSYSENSSGRHKMEVMAETVSEMARIGRTSDIPELDHLAAQYYLATEKSLYGNSADSPISELHVVEATVEEAKNGKSASIQAVETEHGNYQVLKITDKFAEASLEERIMILAHEGVHRIDHDVMGIPGSFGDEVFAYGVSTESAAHMFQYKIYQELRKVNPSFIDQEMENLGKLVRDYGLVGLLQYGIAYAQIYRSAGFSKN